MTEGLILLTNGEKIDKALYVNSDAYFSWLGVRLLEKFKDGSLKDFISNYNNTKYNKINKEMKEFYHSNYNDTAKNRKKILELTNKIECRTYCLKVSEKCKYDKFLKQLCYVPTYIYRYNKDKNMLLVKGCAEQYEVTIENVDEYIDKFNEDM